MKNNLKIKRQELHLTQKQVADMLGLSESAYRRYELGSVVPNAFLANRMAKALQTTSEELFPIDS